MVYLYNLKNRKIIKSFNGHKQNVSSIKFLEKNIIVTGSRDGVINIWDIDNPNKPVGQNKLKDNI